MEKEIIIIGDLEMGAGTLTDDFISDNAFALLMRSISDKKHPVDLVFNGDTFDFMRCPIRDGGRESYPRHIDKEVSIAKLNRMAKAHKKVFMSFHDFISLKKNRLFFIVGNHDLDLFFPEVQEALKNLIGGHKKNIIFPGYECTIDGIYIEHGHQYDLFFQLDPEQLFFLYKDKKILNMSVTNYWIMSHIIPIKEQYPLFERLPSRPVAHYKTAGRETFWKTTDFLAKNLFYYPFRHYNDPTYHSVIPLVKEFLKRLKNEKWNIHTIWDPVPIVDIFTKKRRNLIEKNSISILGHTHKKAVKKLDNHTIIHTSAWRDEYFFNTETRQMIPKTQGYLSIKINNNKFSYELIDVPIKRSIMNFDVAMKDEIKHLYIAAEEEGYPLSL